MRAFNIKSVILGAILGAVIVGSIWYVLNSQSSKKYSFIDKVSCASYIQKRQVEGNEKGQLLNHGISVEGFYSSVANTCMTNTTEIASTYIQLTLVDELTRKTEAFAFEATGEELKALSPEAMREQIQQDISYREKLKYFRGE